ncbi:MAG: hypothetical protein NT154_10300, partial [Verrucomicrobia bacterium]|nr:hypothetical protein [Verrucomicrobiota bacterium]
VIQPLPGSQLLMNANVGSFMALHAGTGSANTNSLKWNAFFNGVAYARGSRLQANGDLGPLVVDYVSTTDTNNFPDGYIPRVVLKGIKNMTITSGKIFGQKVRNNLKGISLPATHP